MRVSLTQILLLLLIGFLLFGDLSTLKKHAIKILKKLSTFLNEKTRK